MLAAMGVFTLAGPVCAPTKGVPRAQAEKPTGELFEVFGMTVEAERSSKGDNSYAGVDIRR